MKESVFLENLALYKDPIFRYCLSLLKNYHDAEDATQEIFIKLFQQNLEDETHIRNWLYRSSYNYCMSIFRTKWKAVILDDELLAQLPDHQQKQEMEILLQCPKKYYSVLYLNYYEGFTQNEIASILGISLDVVKKRVLAGKRWLKEYLGKEAENEEKYLQEL